MAWGGRLREHWRKEWQNKRNAEKWRFRPRNSIIYRSAGWSRTTHCSSSVILQPSRFTDWSKPHEVHWYDKKYLATCLLKSSLYIFLVSFINYFCQYNNPPNSLEFLCLFWCTVFCFWIITHFISRMIPKTKKKLRVVVFAWLLVLNGPFNCPLHPFRHLIAPRNNKELKFACTWAG